MPYDVVTIVGYNANPPEDDGSQTSTNEVAWDKHTGKIGDPLKNAIDDIQDAIGASVDTIDLAIEGAIFGLTISNNVSDATNDLDIAAGSARDSTNTDTIRLSSSITKRLDAAWAVGSGNGGKDAGSTVNVTHHIWLIKRSDTGVVDVLISESATAPTMPTNYDLKRRIGSIIRTGGANLAFRQDGDVFQLVTKIAERSDTATVAWGLITLGGIPTGIKVQPLLTGYLEGTTGSNLIEVGDARDTGQLNAVRLFWVKTAGAAYGALSGGIFSDTSARIFYVCTEQTTINDSKLETRGERIRTL